MHPDRPSYGAENCSIARTLEIVGEKWTLLVLREAFYGVRRFADLKHNLGCASNVLSARLNTLVDAGILERRSYREPKVRSHLEYRLTEKGLDLYPILIALMQWGDRYVADSAGPAVEITHGECHRPVHVEVRCERGCGPLGARDAEIHPGAGARAVA